MARRTKTIDLSQWDILAIQKSVEKNLELEESSRRILLRWLEAATTIKIRVAVDNQGVTK